MTVTLRASAAASAGTPAGNGNVMVAPGESFGPGRESNRRVDGRGTNLPEAAVVAGTNAPTTSTTTCERVDVKTRNVPAASRRVIEPFARIWLTSKLTFETTGRDRSDGQAVRKPEACGFTTVRVSANDVALDGMPQIPRAATCNVSASTRTNPLFRRVSARRHGCTDT